MSNDNGKFRPRHENEEWLGERLFVRELMNNANVPNASLAACRVLPGVTTQLHSLSVDETYIIRAGGGLMERGGGVAYAVATGDCVHIPAGTSQRITNHLDEDLLFDCLCTPRFTPESYTNLENDD